MPTLDCHCQNKTVPFGCDELVWTSPRLEQVGENIATRIKYSARPASRSWQ